jgi:hypothetical protein
MCVWVSVSLCLSVCLPNNLLLALRLLTTLLYVTLCCALLSSLLCSSLLSPLLCQTGHGHYLRSPLHWLCGHHCHAHHPQHVRRHDRQVRLGGAETGGWVSEWTQPLHVVMWGGVVWCGVTVMLCCAVCDVTVMLCCAVLRCGPGVAP